MNKILNVLTIIKMNKIFNYSMIIAAAITVSLSSCDSDSLDVNNSQGKLEAEPNETYAKDMAVSSNSNAFKLLAIANKADGDKNIAISPLSLNEVLAMMSNGARGTTQSEIWSAIGYKGANQDFVNESFYSINKLLPELDPDSTTLYIANSLWINEGLSVKDDFINANKKYFKAEVRQQNLATTQTMNDINQWCSEKTNGKIPNFLNSELSSDDRVFGINALYFKGLWREIYKKSAEKYDFRCADGTYSPIEVFEGYCDYARDKNLIIARFPYGNGSLCMDVIIPNRKLEYDSYGSYYKDVVELDYIINDYLDINRFDSICNIEYQREKFIMPIFKLDTQNNFTPVLKEIGMKSAFDPESANLSGMSDESLCISNVLQKVVIEVDEKGTVAVAGTSYRATFLSSSNVLYFNRPFVYVIRDRKYNTILFAGKVAKL